MQGFDLFEWGLIGVRSEVSVYPGPSSHLFSPSNLQGLRLIALLQSLWTLPRSEFQEVGPRHRIEVRGKRPPASMPPSPGCVFQPGGFSGRQLEAVDEPVEQTSLTIVLNITVDSRHITTRDDHYPGSQTGI